MKRAGHLILWLVGILMIAIPAVGLGTKTSYGVDYLTSYHRNTFWLSAQVGSLGWHGGTYTVPEDAIDLLDPGCTSTGGCETAYFRYEGLGQFAADYTLTDYAISSNCTGRTLTVRYYSGGTWKPLIKLNYVHMKSQRASLSGSLSYSDTVDLWVGVSDHTQPGGCSWTTPQVHFSRLQSYGINAHNGASGFGDAYSWVGSDEVTFLAYGN